MGQRQEGGRSQWTKQGLGQKSPASLLYFLHSDQNTNNLESDSLIDYYSGFSYVNFNNLFNPFQFQLLCKMEMIRIRLTKVIKGSNPRKVLIP